MAVAVAGEEQHIRNTGAKPGVVTTRKAGSTNNNQGGAKSDDDLVFLYRLTPGQVAPSFGVHCAALAGVQERVVARARQIIEYIGNREPIKKQNHPDITARSKAFHNLVTQLLTLDCKSVEQARALLQAASKVAR